MNIITKLQEKLNLVKIAVLSMLAHLIAVINDDDDDDDDAAHIFEFYVVAPTKTNTENHLDELNRCQVVLNSKDTIRYAVLALYRREGIKYVLDTGDALEPLAFPNARLAIANYASTTGCNLIALTQNIDGHCDVLYRNGKIACYIADYDAIAKAAKSKDFAAGDSFFDGMRNVGTYSDEELANL